LSSTPGQVHCGLPGSSAGQVALDVGDVVELRNTVKRDPTVMSSSSSPIADSPSIPRWPTETSEDVLRQNTFISELLSDDSEQEDETECYNCGHAGDAASVF
jgi:hypothetical protein